MTEKLILSCFISKETKTVLTGKEGDRKWGNDSGRKEQSGLQGEQEEPLSSPSITLLTGDLQGC